MFFYIYFQIALVRLMLTFEHNNLKVLVWTLNMYL